MDFKIVLDTGGPAAGARWHLALARPNIPAKSLKAMRRPRSDGTRWTYVRRIMREIFGPEGPNGIINKCQLEMINKVLAERGRSEISLSTLQRARKAEYPLWSAKRRRP
jgi:hypothetical protein